MSKLVSLIGLVLLSMMSYGQTFSDFSREEVIADLEFLYHQLKAVHPNSEGLQEEGVSKLINELNAEFYSEADAFFIFNGLLKELNDGHSNIKFSSDRTKDLLLYGVFFPYELEFFDSTAVITGAVGTIQSDFKRREIFKINNVPIKKILKELTVVAMMDGECNESAAEWLAEDFWFYFSLYNGFRSSYSITYIEEERELHEIVKAINRGDVLKSSILDDFRSQPFELHYLSETPVLEVSNFNQKSSFWWRRKLKSVFNELNENGKEDLVLDLRNNGGGQENLQNVLLEAFGIVTGEKYEYEAIRTLDFKALEGVLNPRRERLKSFGLEQFRFTGSREAEFKKRRKRNKCTSKSPLFNGNLFVLLDGTTFSCASDAAAILKQHYPNTVLLGTETRGSGKVNYAGYFVHISLPNTSIEVRIPRVKYILNNSGFSADSGVIPDVRVEMKLLDIQSNIDTQLSYVINLLNKEKDQVQSN